MKIELKKWSIEDKESLIRICNTIDRNYLSCKFCSNGTPILKSAVHSF